MGPRLTYKGKDMEINYEQAKTLKTVSIVSKIWLEENRDLFPRDLERIFIDWIEGKHGLVINENTSEDRRFENFMNEVKHEHFDGEG